MFSAMGDTFHPIFKQCIHNAFIYVNIYLYKYVVKVQVL